MSWIGVDFDGTLAVYAKWDQCGEPIEQMVWRVRGWIHQGKEVRIFTVRVSSKERHAQEQRERIQEWCRQYLGKTLEVTAEKDSECEAIYDDIAYRVEKNTGVIL